MIAIGCEGISLSYGTDVILDGITFSINEGDKVGVVGVNGAGKTTLFKFLSGESEPDSGSVFRCKGKTIGYLKQHIEYESDKTLYDDLISRYTPPQTDDNNVLEAHKGEFISRCRGILKNLGFSEAQSNNLIVSSLSGGQKTRLALAAMLLRDDDILMLDEPTNHLDIDSLNWLEDLLRGSKKTVLVISHDRYFLDRVTTRTLEVENHHAKLYNGNYTAYVQKKTTEREVQERHYQNQQKEIARIEAYIEQQRRWNREKNIIAAESRQKMLDKMVREERPEALPDKIRLSFNSAGRSGDDVLSVRGISKSYPERELFSDISFEIKYKDHAFIYGENGCGKSTLIKIIAGRLSQDRGVIDCGYNVIPGYYDQENQQLSLENSVMDELWSVNESMSPTEIRNTLALFLFRGDDCYKQVSTLSGGEKARLSLAKLIMSRNNLLILDEPTNHLDINSREALENALLEYDGTIIAVSHDRYFIKKLATRMLVFGAVEEGKIFDYKGTYEEFLRYKEQYLTPTDSSNKATKTETASKTAYLRKKEEQAEIRKYQTRIQNAKKKAAELEKRLSEIDDEIEKFASDHKKLAELWEEKETKEEELMALYEFLEENNAM